MLRTSLAALAAATLLSLYVDAPLPAQAPPGSQLLVTAKWLATHQHDKNLVILAIGPQPAYLQEHIPGARFVDATDIMAPGTPGGSGIKVLPEAQLKATLEKKYGISDQSQIVVVSDSEWFSPSTRIVLTLQYAGLGARTVLLDGGTPAWRKAGYPVTADFPAPPVPGHITTAIVPDLIVDHDYVAAHLRTPKVKLIDVREAVCYSPAGCGRENGHIPGAMNIPLEALFDDSTGFFLPKQQLETIFRNAGVQPGDTVVTYCHVGQRASAGYFAALLLGHPARVYDGSFRDWISRNLPTEGGH